MATGNLCLIGGPNDGGYPHRSLEDVELGQYAPFPGHPPMPIPSTYSRSAFYVAEPRDDGSD